MPLAAMIQEAGMPIKQHYVLLSVHIACSVSLSLTVGNKRTQKHISVWERFHSDNLLEFYSHDYDGYNFKHSVS